MTVAVYVRCDTASADVARRASSQVRTQLGSILGTERRIDIVVCADTEAGDVARDWCAEHRVRCESAPVWWIHDDADPLLMRDATTLGEHRPTWAIDTVDGRADWPDGVTVRRVGGAR